MLPSCFIKEKGMGQMIIPRRDEEREIRDLKKKDKGKRKVNFSMSELMGVADMMKNKVAEGLSYNPKVRFGQKRMKLDLVESPKVGLLRPKEQQITTLGLSSKPSIEGPHCRSKSINLLMDLNPHAMDPGEEMQDFSGTTQIGLQRDAEGCKLLRSRKSIPAGLPSGMELPRRLNPEELCDILTLQEDPLVFLELFNWASQQPREMDDVVNQVLAIPNMGSEALYNTMIYYFTDNGKLSRAVNIFRHMKKSRNLDCRPSTRTYNLLFAAFFMIKVVNSLALGGETDEAVNFLWEMIEKHRSVDFITYCTLLDEICRKGRAQQALYLLNKLQEKRLVDEITYRKLSNVLEDDFNHSIDKQNQECAQFRKLGANQKEHPARYFMLFMPSLKRNMRSSIYSQFAINLVDYVGVGMKLQTHTGEPPHFSPQQSVVSGRMILTIILALFDPESFSKMEAPLDATSCPHQLDTSAHSLPEPSRGSSSQLAKEDLMLT
ncbi:Pentatricopeptide repeat [Dillenia turbinata]|uniref:Pentatricopeptide repeat n=1 Tax=Dillenia turbinata TaxID=194707 RepID=A0AAN8VYX5_9MAGN